MTLQRALLVSIALHALLLAIVRPPQTIPRETSNVLLVARLVQPATTLTPIELEAPRPIKPIRLPKRIAAIAPHTYPAPRPETTIEAQPAPPAEERSVATEASAEAGRQPVAQIEAPQLDPGAVARYRLEIISAAKQFRRYPPIARENGWQGRAEVRVSFAGAREPAVVLKSSSGFAVLDRQALETLTKALAPLPPPLAGGIFELDFPVVFSLDE